MLRAAAPGPTVVPKGSLEIDAKPEVATSAHRALGAAASPPAVFTDAIILKRIQAAESTMGRAIHIAHTSFNSGQKIDRTPDPAPPACCC